LSVKEALEYYTFLLNIVSRKKTNLISGSYYDLVRFIDNLAVNFFFGDPVDIMDVLVHL